MDIAEETAAETEVQESKSRRTQTTQYSMLMCIAPIARNSSLRRQVIDHVGNERSRSDAAWSVPEPELTLVINAVGEILERTVEATLAELKRDPKELVEYLFRDNSFHSGVFPMTRTGIVPGDHFTLAGGDIIRIEIEDIGTMKISVI
ncbi:hypothetical protein [Granulicella arctica]|uniref:Fumarylacetoacetate (FAA) hydrolase family protein n=1 Tax=Granulicella arctica TaxID=940613 RepID=A0A7Y9PJ62_9BACT|nr:hypothetical protein [Granulicella arctica]NYF80091.1 fumarylacetoacetate (FAA) hydrolase family protein [Granulicella arctica]